MGVLVVLQEDETEEISRAGTLINIKAYSICSALYKFAYSWDAIKVSALANRRKNFCGQTLKRNLKGLRLRIAEDIPRLRGAETGPSDNDVRDWLEEP